LTAKAVIWGLAACQGSIYNQIVQLIWYVKCHPRPTYAKLDMDVVYKPNINLHVNCLYGTGKFWRATCEYGWRNCWSEHYESYGC
jgi:hypothetical protein